MIPFGRSPRILRHITSNASTLLRPSAYAASHHARKYATANDPSPISSAPPSSLNARTRSPHIPTTFSHPPPHPPPPPPPPPRNRLLTPRRLVLATTFFLLGLTLGQTIRTTVLPPPLPLPSTPEDAELTSYLDTTCSSLPLVLALRAERTPSGLPAWTEWSAYAALPYPDSARPARLTTGPLSGSRGLPVQRCFWNPTTHELIVVIFFGGALCGWPGIVHGGALATVFDECLGRIALRGLEARTGVTAFLEMRYRVPVRAGQFYVFRGRRVEEGSGERKAVVEGALEDLEGRVSVEGRGLFVVPSVVPKGVELMAIPDEF